MGGEGIEWYKLWAFPSCSLIKLLCYNKSKILFLLDILNSSHVTSRYEGRTVICVSSLSQAVP